MDVDLLVGIYEQYKSTFLHVQSGYMHIVVCETMMIISCVHYMYPIRYYSHCTSFNCHLECIKTSKHAHWLCCFVGPLSITHLLCVSSKHLSPGGLNSAKLQKTLDDVKDALTEMSDNASHSGNAHDKFAQ